MDAVRDNHKGPLELAAENSERAADLEQNVG